MKILKIAAAIACGVVGQSFAATYVTNNVDGLIYLLNTYNNTAGTVIELEAGDYMLPSDPMTTETNPGASSLYVNRPTIRGKGVTAADTRLVGNGVCRVVRGTQYAVLENLTITNGYAKLVSGYKYSNRGGGYYGNGVLTNCIVKCNSSDGVGGGLQGGATLYKCIVEGNESGSGGGGGHTLTAYGTMFRYNKSTTNNGGGLYGCTLYGCEVVSNTAGAYGGGCFNPTYVTNTLIAYNTAQYGGGVANGSSQSPSDYLICGCAVSNNVAEGPGGTSAGTGGGIYRQLAVGCAIGGNRAVYGGGAIDSVLTNCIVSGNSTWYSGGGGTYNCTVVGCTISGNSGKGNGGGVYDDVGSVISNCTISANVVSNDSAHAYGAGIYLKGGSASDCRIFGNAAFSCPSATDISRTYAGNGGGVAATLGGTLHGCSIYDNFASSYGGGIHSVSAVGCVISNNLSISTGPNANSCRLEGCDVWGTPVVYGSASRTVFHGVRSEMPFANNPYHSGTIANTYVYYYPNCTNCLFHDNILTGDSSRIFEVDSKDVGASVASSLVNCTVVSNNCVYMFKNFSSSARSMSVQNCVFFGNRNRLGTAAQDLNQNGCTSEYLRFAYCAYVVASSTNMSTPSDWFDAGEYVFGSGSMPANPRFMNARDARHPYSLAPSSPLRGRAQVQDWMTGAYDFRGDADGGIYLRLRDSVADLGCYQCWLDPDGTWIIIR